MSSTVREEAGHRVTQNKFSGDPRQNCLTNSSLSKHCSIGVYDYSNVETSVDKNSSLVSSRHERLPEQGIVDVYFLLPFYVTVSNLLDTLRHLQKLIAVANTEPASPTICKCFPPPSNPDHIETPEKGKSRALLRKTTILDTDKAFGTVYNKHPVDCATHMKLHDNAQNEDAERLAHDYW